MKPLTLSRMTKNKAFTIIELLVSLGLSSIIVILIMSFFINSFNIYKSIKDSNELHYQAQYILNFIVGKAINSKSISLIKADDLTNYSMTKVRDGGIEYPVRKISFKYGEEVDNNYVFHIVGNNIRYGNGKKDTNPSVELGNYVEEMHISLLKDESFQNTRILKIIIILKKGGQKYEAFQTAYMRNN